MLVEFIIFLKKKERNLTSIPTPLIGFWGHIRVFIGVDVIIKKLHNARKKKQINANISILANVT